ncbi:MAG: ribonuclease Z [Saprospiraceae bacterium]|nr:ribonuclease Z [Saprospiraceae bacterium]
MQKGKKNSIHFELLILGSSSAIPSDARFPSSQVLRIGEELFLIDCGEASQNRLWSHRVRWSKIGWILISHLHGDHVYGLPGLITSFCHLQRTQPLIITGPLGIRDFLENILRHSQVHLTFDIEYLELDQKVQVIYKDDWRKITAFPLDHRIPTMGYLFEAEKKIRRLDLEKIQKTDIPLDHYQKVVKGETVQDSAGRIYNPDELSFIEIFKRSYAYCSDTRYKESLVSVLKNVDVLYHETTYLHELLDKAIQTGHTTAKQAAEFAKLIQAGQLITGHYSSRYKILTPILEECQSIFPNTVLGYEGLKLEILPRGNEIG